MKEQIFALEKKLFQYTYMKDHDWLNEILHDHFQECGKSGCIFNKETVISSLNGYTEDRMIEIYNYEYLPIDTNTHMIHYVTKNGDALIYRTSIWIMEKHLKLLFHQASPLKTDIPLIKYESIYMMTR